MTGYGKATGTYQHKKIAVELRSLNSKGGDVYLKCPTLYKSKEIPIRKALQNQLDRGKIECVITVESADGEASVAVNRPLVVKYYNELSAISDAVGAEKESLLPAIMRFPEVLISKEEDLEEGEWEVLEKILWEAIEKLDNFRKEEGETLEADFDQSINAIREMLEEVPKYEQARIDTVRERMQKSIEELQVKHDDNRLEQELIYYIEKLDITEEKTRLAHHLDYFQETMKKEAPNGKKLGFIGQEIGREINTLGSKSYHADMQRLVVQMKDHLEKIKEQVLNTL